MTHILSVPFDQNERKTYLAWAKKNGTPQALRHIHRAMAMGESIAMGGASILRAVDYLRDAGVTTAEKAVLAKLCNALVPPVEEAPCNDPGT